MEWDAEIAGAFSLAGRTVVITGGGSGLGQETARIMALAGAQIVIGDIDASRFVTGQILSVNGGESI